MELVSLDNPMDRGAWWATVHWVTKTLTRLKWFSTRACMFSDQESYNSDMVQGIHGAPCAKGYNTGNLDIHAKGMLDTLWYTDQLESFWKRMKTTYLTCYNLIPNTVIWKRQNLGKCILYNNLTMKNLLFRFSHCYLKVWSFPFFWFTWKYSLSS